MVQLKNISRRGSQDAWRQDELFGGKSPVMKSLRFWLWVCELHVAFKIFYLYDYITKLCRTQAEVILNRVNPNVRGIGQGEAMRRKYKRLEYGGGQANDRSAD
jgi:hypothetical protein